MRLMMNLQYQIKSLNKLTQLIHQNISIGIDYKLLLYLPHVLIVIVIPFVIGCIPAVTGVMPAIH